MILVSACLTGVNCKYDGSNNLSADVLEFLREKGCFIACCPELLGGLAIPRGPYEITGGTGVDVIEEKAEVISDKGERVTVEFLKGARMTLRIARQNHVDLAILRSRSPSCGIGRTHDGTFSGALIEGDGVTAALLRAEGIKLVSDEEITQDTRLKTQETD
jgi:uncharacterized protein YbbK (DUF523 family)